MGLLDWLTGKRGSKVAEGGAKGDPTIARLQKKLMNKYHQTTERKRAIKLLADAGTDEAIRALLGRFTFVTDGSIVDEDEKTLVYDVIRGFGPRAVPALTEFIKTQSAVYWPLKALTEIAGEEAAIEVVFAALDSINDRFERSMERMTNLVSCLRDYHHPKVLSKLIELSRDEMEEIRFLAVDGLTTFDDSQDAVNAIIERLLDEGETTRVKTYIIDMLIDRKWKVKRFKKDLVGKLPENYFIDDTGIIQRRF